VDATAITLTVNGSPQTTTTRTLAQWLDQQGLKPQAVATALNGQFVPRTQRAAQVLNDGDNLVTFQPIEGG
jgi:sulfur carrier protein